MEINWEVFRPNSQHHRRQLPFAKEQVLPLLSLISCTTYLESSDCNLQYPSGIPPVMLSLGYSFLNRARYQVWTATLSILRLQCLDVGRNVWTNMSAWWVSNLENMWGAVKFISLRRAMVSTGLTSSPPRCVWSPSPRSPCRVDGRWSRIPAETILALFLASFHFNFGPLSYDLVSSSLNVLASHVAASEHQQLRKKC